MNTLKRRWVQAAVAVGLLGLAAAFLLRFSYSTSFLWPGYCGYDSAIFQTIGKYWAEGSVPYRDLFDHKGPLIFFIDMVGYWIHGRAGILVPQTVSLAASLFSSISWAGCICPGRGRQRQRAWRWCIWPAPSTRAT